jgi:dihydrofolate reductase
MTPAADWGRTGIRKLIITENITIDGVIDLSGGWFTPPENPDDDADILAANQRHDRTADAVLLGRQAFEDFRGYWPKQTDDRTGITAYLNSVQKYVLSSTLTEPDWENTTIVRGELVKEVEALKAEPGNDIVCAGSVSVAQALVGTGLVDEYRLFVYPVVMGTGGRLFQESPTMPRLELVESEIFQPGVVLLSLPGR